MDKVFALDDHIFTWVQEGVGKSHILDNIFIFLAQYLVYAVPILVIILWFWSLKTKKAVFISLIAALIAWRGFSKLIAALVDRPRPKMALMDAKELIFHRPDTSFPSDHATMLFALAVSLRLFGLKQLGNVMLIMAIVISIARVWVGVHFPFDILAGAILGTLVAVFIWLIREYIDKYLTNPIIGFLKKFRL